MTEEIREHRTDSLDVPREVIDESRDTAGGNGGETTAILGVGGI
jgi:hypothetical protein